MFLKFPEALITNKKYKALSSDAKILYIHLYARRELSVKNNWVDENNKPYVYFTREQMGTLLDASVSTACRAFKQLRNAGLVRTEQCKTGYSPRIYVTDLLSSANVKKQDLTVTDEADAWELELLKAMAVN